MEAPVFNALKLREPFDLSNIAAIRISLIENLNIDNIAARWRFATRRTDKRIRLAQSEEGVRCLGANRRKISVLAFSSDIMRAIAVVTEIAMYLGSHFRAF